MCKRKAHLYAALFSDNFDGIVDPAPLHQVTAV